MFELEVIVFFAAAFVALIFLLKWYRLLFGSWPKTRIRSARILLGWLPFISLVIIFITLKELASFDVVNDFFYLLLYCFLGIAWLYFGLFLLFLCFDISWADDAINHNNKAALISIFLGALGNTLIYCGANIGDGPGWWCVVFAGGLGLISWIGLGLFVNLFTNIFERITVDRNIGCGIRFGCYLFACGIILGRASGGDWTSFYKTIEEFSDSWPVLPLTLFWILIERYYLHQEKSKYKVIGNPIFGSVFYGIVYISIAIASLFVLPPLPENPAYDLLSVFGGLL